MLLSSDQIELYVVSPADLLVAFLAWVAVTLLAVGFAVWVLRPAAVDGPAVADPVVDPVESTRTVELPRGHAGGPRTGTLHGPRYTTDGEDDATVLIKAVGRP